MSLRDSILAAKPAQKTVTLKTLKDPRGKPLRVTVRGLTISEQLEARRLMGDKDDDFQRGLLMLTFAIRDPKTGKPVFTPDDIVELGELKAGVMVELTNLYAEVRAEVQEKAKKSRAAG